MRVSSIRSAGLSAGALGSVGGISRSPVRAPQPVSDGESSGFGSGSENRSKDENAERASRTGLRLDAKA